MTERIFNLKRGPVDLRDKVFRSTAIQTPQELPDEVDLRPRFGDIPIFDQGSIGSCTANASTALVEYVHRLDNNYMYFYLSRLFLYYHARALHGWEDEDSGAFIRDTMKVLANTGICTESYFPYDVTAFRNKPTLEADENAQIHKIREYHSILTLDALKVSLAEGFPVVVGIDMLTSFLGLDVANTGIVPDKQGSDSIYGGHAVLAVGYIRIEGKFYIIFRNSWGPEWGDGGYFYLPETYWPYHMFDMWTIRLAA